MLGTHIMIELLRRGEPVRALVRPNSNITGIQQVFEFYGSSDFNSIQWAVGDVLDIPSLLDAAKGCTRIFHCAAVVSYHAADRNAMYTVNVEGTENVINTALHYGNIKVAFVSSIAAVGKAKNNDTLDEESEWVESDMNTHYAITKNRSEMEFWRGIHEGIEGVAFNSGFIIGPGDSKRSSPSLFRKLNEGMAFYPPGGTGFIAATDCAYAIVELTLSSISGERYIVVSENLSMKELFQNVAKALGKNIPTREAKPWILELARIAEAVKEKMSGRKALVTKETVKNATLRFYYTNEKLKAAVPMTFKSITQAIDETAAFFKKHGGLND